MLLVLHNLPRSALRMGRALVPLMRLDALGPLGTRFSGLLGCPSPSTLAPPCPLTPS
ncbi:hypothetical protein BJV78DRAFT_1176675 [Lactifluus subvellereus]|nr:hypothetical protein BJV78DRAFT_1176675 [Lactifluus subvellereus]